MAGRYRAGPGTLLLAKAGLLAGIPSCTDLTSKPWVQEAGIEVLEQPFFARGNLATAGGCLASIYLAAWTLARLVGRDAANAQKAATEAKTATTSLKQELAANKTVADGAAAKIDGMASSVSQQSKGVQELKERLDKMSLEMTALDSLAARIRSHDEAIAAIDDYRRTTNRELLQIKQQLSAKP